MEDDRGFLLDIDASITDVYSKLESGELRVLLLAPGQKGTPIQCKIDVIFSSKSVQFEALSYVWGDTKKSHAISCNGFDFAVTESLHTALQHLRYPDSSRRLWVDQLCINQDRDDETRVQVAQMGTIYSSATRVVVWLGQCNRKMSVAWELLQQTSLSSSLARSDFLSSSSTSSTSTSTSTKPPRSPRRQSSSSSISKHSSRASRFRSSNSREPLSSSVSSANNVTPTRPKSQRQDTPPSLKSALLIFQHTWFGRKWTFQEIILAKAAIICCGDLEMAWSDLTSWYFHYASKLRGYSLLYDSHGSFETVMNVRNEIGKGNLTLSNLLMLTRPRSSLKAEDAIYALLGLLPDFAQYLTKNQNPLAVRDSRSSQADALFDLYLQAFRYCLEKENALTVLSAAGKYKGNVEMLDWPSWLPDWRQQLPLRPLILSDSTVLGPESSFDDETFGTGISNCNHKEESPVYMLKAGSDTPLPYSNQEYTMTVRGIRLGCLAVRPGTWPSIFLIPERLASSHIQSPNAAPGGQKYSRSINELIPFPLPQPQPSPQQNTSSYAEKLFQKCLKLKATCEPVRTATMVQNGDWLCAFLGGKVLYAVRPLAEAASPRLSLRDRSRAKMKQNRRKLRMPDVSSPSKAEISLRCTFIGECAMNGLYPSDVLDKNPEHILEFELV
ncbi:hypothetical protein PV10_03583 [Exophiala mesophila]|uniref:Heterokaryon incompatibility domain-containing protein n=1 Tax=Exophiala mesophila TaxID=212818 RepID=A0A0D1ZQ04_EXOME|nr:uncharacterized protein PV10_03583 [Exophiala mesophila]KIV95999.1 hypothetical protein PV10_03583 [Exophiala mesophila]